MGYSQTSLCPAPVPSEKLDTGPARQRGPCEQLPHHSRLWVSDDLYGDSISHMCSLPMAGSQAWTVMLPWGKDHYTFVPGFLWPLLFPLLILICIFSLRWVITVRLAVWWVHLVIRWISGGLGTLSTAQTWWGHLCRLCFPDSSVNWF